MTRLEGPVPRSAPQRDAGGDAHGTRAAAPAPDRAAEPAPGLTAREAPEREPSTREPRERALTAREAPEREPSKPQVQPRRAPSAPRSRRRWALPLLALLLIGAALAAVCFGAAGIAPADALASLAARLGIGATPPVAGQPHSSSGNA